MLLKQGIPDVLDELRKTCLHANKKEQKDEPDLTHNVRNSFISDEWESMLPDQDTRQEVSDNIRLAKVFQHGGHQDN